MWQVQCSAVLFYCVFLRGSCSNFWFGSYFIFRYLFAAYVVIIFPLSEFMLANPGASQDLYLTVCALPLALSQAIHSAPTFFTTMWRQRGLGHGKLNRHWTWFYRYGLAYCRRKGTFLLEVIERALTSLRLSLGLTSFCRRSRNWEKLGWYVQLHPMCAFSSIRSSLVLTRDHFMFFLV